MYKKTLLSLAIASTLTLTGCLENDKLEDENIGADANGLTPEETTELETAAGTYPIWNPAISALPIPNDLIFDSVAGDGTFSVPDSSPPVTTALNSLSGASTVAPIDIAMSGKIDPESIEGSVLSGPLQNVFLIELAYASGSPAQGLPIGEKATVVPPTGVDYTATEIELDNTSFIRINPIKPLKPNTRYIAVVTNEIKDNGTGTDQLNIQASPSYKHITGSDPLLADSLSPIRALTNDLWETVAVGFFNAPNSTNQQRALASLPNLTADNIALSYSFTTSGDEKVMEYIANPSEWFNDQLTTFIGVNTAESVVTNETDVDQDGDVDYTDINLAINATAGVEGFDGAIASFPSVEIQAALDAAGLSLAAVQSVPGCDSVTSGSTYISCLSAILGSTQTGAPFANLLPTPEQQAATTTSANTPVGFVSAAVSTLVDDALAATPPLVSQGTIDVPFYLGIPAGNEAADGAVINSQSWTADSNLATAINAAFYSIGLELPQGRTTDPAAGFSPSNPPSFADFTVAPKSSAVNYIYPFPKQSDADTETDVTDNLTIPWVAVYPHPASGVSAKGTVIYQHGITTDRSAVLSAGTVLAQQGFTVIGIDQAAHGIAPISTEDKLDLADSLLTAGQEGGLPESLEPNDTNNAAIVGGVLASGFTTQSLAAAGLSAVISTDDAITNSLTGTLPQEIVTRSLHGAGVIDISDGIDGTEQLLIDSAFDNTLAEKVVTSELHTAGAINAADGIDAGEQGLIDAVIAGATGNDAFATLEAAAAQLVALQGSTDLLTGLQTAIVTLTSFENTVANAGGIIPGIAPTDNERHFNFTADATLQPVPMNYEADSALGSSGSLYINLSGFTNSRDKNRQGVIDLLNLRQSLANIDLNGDTTAGDLDTTNVYFTGHSLGTVTGIPFVTVANSAPNIGNIEAASFLEPASGLSRMFENSSSFAPSILGGLAASTNGTVVQGSSSLESFLNVFQATLDSSDPINFADNLGGSTSGSFQTNAEAKGSLLIVNVGTADGNGTTVFKSDQTNIIEAETTQLSTQFGTATKSYFAGVEKFADALGVSDVIGATLDGSADKLRTRLAFGNHGMFVLPVVSDTETEALGETEAAAEALRRGAAFKEGFTQTATFFGTNGEMAGITDESGLTGVPSILINQTDYDARPNKQLN